MEKSRIKKTKGRGGTQFPGITEDARRLGVNRTTLWRMLKGTPGFENLKTLRKRYEALQRNK